MITAGELAAMRRTSLAALPDLCVIARPGARPGVLDDNTGLLAASAASQPYSGACRVRPVTSADQTAVFGDTDVTRQRYVATLPHDAAPAVDDIVTVTASSDPSIAARSFRVVIVASGSWLIDRRVGLEVIE